MGQSTTPVVRATDTPKSGKERGEDELQKVRGEVASLIASGGILNNTPDFRDVGGLDDVTDRHVLTALLHYSQCVLENAQVGARDLRLLRESLS